MDIRKTKEAERDLIEIYLYGYTNFGEDQAESYFSSLEAAFGIIQDNPNIGYERTEFSPPVRSYIHKQHVIIYAVETDTILIVRILGKMMDIPRHVSE